MRVARVNKADERGRECGDGGAYKSCSRPARFRDVLRHKSKQSNQIITKHNCYIYVYLIELTRAPTVYFIIVIFTNIHPFPNCSKPINITQATFHSFARTKILINRKTRLLSISLVDYLCFIVFINGSLFNKSTIILIDGTATYTSQILCRCVCAFLYSHALAFTSQVHFDLIWFLSPIDRVRFICHLDTYTFWMQTNHRCSPSAITFFGFDNNLIISSDNR